MSVPSFPDLPQAQRRQLISRAIKRVSLTTVGFILLYALLPVPGTSSARALLGLAIGLVVFAGLIVWQIRAILTDDHPGVRAVESVAVSVPLIIVVFASTYLALSKNNPENFTEHLDRVDALYFTMTTLGTVGFGDIAPVTHLGRIVVTIQMLLDFIVLVAVLRAVMFAARVGMSRKQGRPLGDPTDPLDAPD